MLGPHPRRELDAAYADALCLACVSREEGFGFTPLEALAAGVRPVVSDLPVFRGDARRRRPAVPAGDADALAEALLRLEREPELRERLVAAARERVELLSWERAAHQTRAVFEEAPGEPFRGFAIVTVIHDSEHELGGLLDSVARGSSRGPGDRRGQRVERRGAGRRETGAPRWWTSTATAASAPPTTPDSSWCASP